MKELTPKEFQCGIGACSSVFETEDGDLLIIGGKPTELPPGIVFGEDETAVLISRKLVEKSLE